MAQPTYINGIQFGISATLVTLLIMFTIWWVVKTVRQEPPQPLSQEPSSELERPASPPAYSYSDWIQAHSELSHPKAQDIPNRPSEPPQTPLDLPDELDALFHRVMDELPPDSPIGAYLERRRQAMRKGRVNAGGQAEYLLALRAVLGNKDNYTTDQLTFIMDLLETEASTRFDGSHFHYQFEASIVRKSEAVSRLPLTKTERYLWGAARKVSAHIKDSQFLLKTIDLLNQRHPKILLDDLVAHSQATDMSKKAFAATFAKLDPALRERLAKTMKRLEEDRANLGSLINHVALLEEGPLKEALDELNDQPNQDSKMAEQAEQTERASKLDSRDVAQLGSENAHEALDKYFTSRLVADAHYEKLTRGTLLKIEREGHADVIGYVGKVSGETGMITLVHYKNRHMRYVTPLYSDDRRLYVLEAKTVVMCDRKQIFGTLRHTGHGGVLPLKAIELGKEDEGLVNVQLAPFGMPLRINLVDWELTHCGPTVPVPTVAPKTS